MQTSSRISSAAWGRRQAFPQGAHDRHRGPPNASAPSPPGNHGRVIERSGNTIEIEVPADISIGLNAIWGQGGFLAIFNGQTTRQAPRRVIDMNGNTVVCGDIWSHPPMSLIAALSHGRGYYS